MQKLTINEIVKATGGTLVCGGKGEIKEITTDSRKVTDGALFIPLAGERFDGHDFAAVALENGAAAVVTHKDMAAVEGKTIVRVSDTQKALADIARFYKQKYNVPTVSITGSVGKTTTKDIIHSVLGMKYNTLKTEGNYNNEIGLPLTVLRLEKETEAAVIEMGMSHFGEIERLAGIAMPDVAVITNIGMSHIENLGSREGIFKAKTEVTKQFGKDNVLIVNGDDDFLSKTKGMGEYRVVYYGIKNPDNDVFAKDIVNKGIDGTEFVAVTPQGEMKITVNSAGEHNVYNALAAICVGMEFDVPFEKIAEGIASFKLTAMRMSVEEKDGVTVINDCYNASPDSIRAALKVLSSVKDKRRIAILGDVLEMGDFAPKAHYALGTDVKAGADVLITAGKNAGFIADGARDAGMTEVYAFADTDTAREFAGDFVKSGDAALVKASRGMHFEKIYNALISR